MDEQRAQRLLSLAAGDTESIAQAMTVIADAGTRWQLGYLRVRRLLELRWWSPGSAFTGPEYEWAAGELARLGHSDAASVLAGIAGTGEGLRAAAVRWRHDHELRSDAMTRNVRQLEAAGLLRLGKPRRGVDGALYRAGPYSERPGDPGEPAVLVSGRGLDLITGWGSPLAAWQWIETRNPEAGGPLQWPAGQPVPRLVHEEQVLAYALAEPSVLAAGCGPPVPGDDYEELSAAWILSDLRGEILQCAMLAGLFEGSPSSRAVAMQVAERYAWAPAYARLTVGGSDAPLVTTYVSRLAETGVSESTYQAARAALVAAGPVWQPRRACAPAVSRPGAAPLPGPSRHPAGAGGYQRPAEPRTAGPTPAM
jgi:hypothetical protein